MTGTLNTDKQITTNVLTNQDVNCYATYDVQEFELPQELIQRKNIGVMNLVNAEVCNLFPTNELDYLPVKKLPELYIELITSSNSISALIKKVVYRVIMPLMWADRLASRQTRNPKNNQENPKLIRNKY